MENQDKEWTIMIYMAGDNNLSTDMSYALEQIKSVTAQTDKINLFVYYDGYSADVPTLYCDFTEKNRINYYRSAKIENKLIKRGTPEFNENSASVNNIINFVDWCVNKVEYTVDEKTFKGRKANRYAMIFSGHTLGFESKGLFKDEKSDSNMTLARLRWMFERITFDETKLKARAAKQQTDWEEKWDAAKLAERTTPILGKELSILGFDSCVMSMLEIGCQFRTVAETLIASEGSIPNAGWSYAPMLLGKIVDSKDKSSTEIAANFVENFIQQQNKYALADISVDLSAWDLKKLSDLEKSFIKFTDSLLECFNDANSTAFRQMKRIIIQSHWQCQTYMLDQNIDLCDFCNLVSAEIESLKKEFSGFSEEDFDKHLKPVLNVGENCKEVIEKIKDCVIICGFSGSEYQYSNGISLFFPWSWESYYATQKSYLSLSFVTLNEAGRKWNDFLFKYLDEVSRRLAKPLSKRDKNGHYEKDENFAVVYKSYSYIDELADETNTENDGKIPINGTNKIPINGTNKIPINGTNKIPINGTNKIPINGTNKIPINGTNKMFNALSIFFSEFMITKNIRSFWNHSGFTSKTAKFEIEQNSAKESAAPETTANDGIFSTLVVKPIPIQTDWIVNIPLGSNINQENPKVFSYKVESFKPDPTEKLLQLIKSEKENGDLNKLFDDAVLKQFGKMSQTELIDSLIEKNQKLNE